MATHSSVLAWRIPWTEEPGGPQSIGLQRVRHNSLDELSPAYEEHRQRTWKTQHRLKQILFPFPKLPIHPGTLTYSQVREEAGRRTGVDEGGKCRGMGGAGRVSLGVVCCLFFLLGLALGTQLPWLYTLSPHALGTAQACWASCSCPIHRQWNASWQAQLSASLFRDPFQMLEKAPEGWCHGLQSVLLSSP